jgi:hypothetical protein
VSKVNHLLRIHVLAVRPIEDLALRADGEAEPTVVLLLNLTHRADKAHDIDPPDVVAGRMRMNGCESVGVVVVQPGMSSHMPDPIGLPWSSLV